MLHYLGSSVPILWLLEVSKLSCIPAPNFSRPEHPGFWFLQYIFKVVPNDVSFLQKQPHVIGQLVHRALELGVFATSCCEQMAQPESNQACMQGHLQRGEGEARSSCTCTSEVEVETVRARGSCTGDLACNVVAVQVIVFDCHNFLLNELCHTNPHAVSNVLDDSLTRRV
jgi:hypothetical protein